MPPQIEPHDTLQVPAQLPSQAEPQDTLQVPVHVPRHVEGAVRNFFAGAHDDSMVSASIGNTTWAVLLKKLRRETKLSSVFIIAK